jgi:hypothetical protein
VILPVAASYERAADIWQVKGPFNRRHLSRGYDESLFQKILRDRSKPQGSDLFSYVQKWLKDPTGDRGLALLGSYGTGKSTFARHLAYRCADDYLTGQGERVPLLIELRHFSSDQDIQSLVTNELANRRGVEGVTFTRFEALNRLGCFLIILDGFDEMKHGMSREALARNFEEIGKLVTANSRVLLCGRPTIFSGIQEQNRLLLTAPGAVSTSRVKYVPIIAAPVRPSRILPLIKAYAETKKLIVDDASRQRLAEIERELRRKSDLRELLRRPVHIPMLLSILPSLSQDSLSTITRGELYEKFITLTIEREVKKRHAASSSLTVEQRLDFATRLACEMTLQENTRSVSISAIPDELFLMYRRDRQALELVKMEMLSACFLEIKAPDILYFGHKSYTDFLVALRVVRVLNVERATNDYARLFTAETRSFLLDLVSEDDFYTATENLAENYELVFTLVGGPTENAYDARRKQWYTELLFSKTGVSYFTDWPGGASKEAAERFLNACHSRSIIARPSAVAALHSLILHDSDLIVRAALEKLPRRLRPTMAYLRQVLGDDRVQKLSTSGRMEAYLVGELTSGLPSTLSQD